MTANADALAGESADRRAGRRKTRSLPIRLTPLRRLPLHALGRDHRRLLHFSPGARRPDEHPARQFNACGGTAARRGSARSHYRPLPADLRHGRAAAAAIRQLSAQGGAGRAGPGSVLRRIPGADEGLGLSPDALDDRHIHHIGAARLDCRHRLGRAHRLAAAQSYCRSWRWSFRRCCKSRRSIWSPWV